ncbi:MAG: prepilin-type N-terminal cleavage/methylation domain-containing protein [Fidelibacterota bacterium]
MKKHLHQKGYTLTEMLVAMGLLGLVFIFSLNFVRFSNARFTLWHKRADEEIDLSRMQRTMVNDMAEGRFCYQLDSLLVNLSTDSNLIIYTFKNGKIQKNGRTVIDGTLGIDSVRFVLDVWNTKEEKIKKVFADSLDKYLQEMTPNEKEYLFITSYSLKIFTSTIGIDSSHTMRSLFPISAFTPLKLVYRVSHAE